ncbi:MAG: TetR/AcrR family transcriptional regulator [Spirochaetes bacterium]|nr:TetR/AcrR family transcriptional regulator [Spirochaetota bacterium]
MSESEGKEKTRERILQAAKCEFAANGFAGTKLDAIARRAGVNKALVHYYFSSKEELYRQVHRRFFGIGQRNDFLVVFPPVSLRPSQRLYIIIYYLIKIHLKMSDKDLIRIVFWDILEGGRFCTEALRELRLPQLKAIESIIDEGIREGEFEITNVRLFVMFLLSFMGLYVMEREIFGDKEMYRELYGNCTDEEIVHFCLHVAFKSLGKTKEAQIPNIPSNIKGFVDEIIEKVVYNISQGYFAVAFEKVAEMMSRSS